MHKSIVLLGLAFALSLGGCQKQEVDSEQARQDAAAAAAEQARLAAEKACLQKAADAFNGTIRQTPASGFAVLDNTNLMDCPEDIKGPFTSYRYNLRDTADALAAFQTNQRSQDDACQAGLGLTIVEIVTGQDTGMTPCADNLSQGSTLKSNLDTAATRLRTSETDLRTVFANHGFIEQPLNATTPAN